jgi:hypothetical protein
MRSRDAMTQEEGFHILLPQAYKYTPQLMEAVVQENDHGLSCWLLELLSEARNPAALPLFLEYLHSDNTSLRNWAIRGLKLLNTKETRRILWETGLKSDKNSCRSKKC